jgi:hypothetical protein
MILTALRNMTDLNIANIDAHVVVKKYHIDPWLMEAAVNGQRSDVIFKIGMSLKTAGASRDEAAAAIYASRAWKSKHGVNSLGALAKEISRIWAKS